MRRWSIGTLLAAVVVLAACGSANAPLSSAPTAATVDLEATVAARVQATTSVMNAATAAPVQVGQAATTAAEQPTAASAPTSQASATQAAPTAAPAPCPEAGAEGGTADCEKAYQALLAKVGEDYSSCVPAQTAAQACQKPASLENELKAKVNIQLILDSSGSMAETVPGGRKMDIAKQVMTRFVDTLPKQANVALRVYGHVGSNAEKDKALSCSRTDLLYPFAPLNAPMFKQAINSFDATGWTPIAASLQAAQQDFAPYDAATNSNIIYLVSDGIETCDGDPVAAAKALHESNIQAVVNIVGFNTDDQATAQLKAAAEAGGGKYYAASSADELEKIFTQNFNWNEWLKYYNCVAGNATAASNLNTASAYQAANCTIAKANRELGMFFAELNGNSATYGSCDQYIRQQAQARHDKISNVNADNLQQTLDTAQQERTSAINAAQQYNPANATATP